MKIFTGIVRFLAALAASTVMLPTLATAQTSPTTPRTTIDAGAIEGIKTPSGMNAFLGIPYAAPPVRDLRWRDPQPVASWKGVYHADRYGPQCLQPQRGINTNQYSGAEQTSENCLFLNVWAKPGARKAPVIVFLHGGGFFIGSGSMPLYGGEGVAQHGAVFVNLNYRLGVLGFLATPELSRESPHKTSGDYGFLDQIAALKWIKRNIARFGGDPDNVTIAGQSAGSMSVLTLQASPLARGLFQRAVGMSGALIGNAGPASMRTLTAGEADGERYRDLMKAKSIAEMRAIPADRLIVPRVPGSPSVGPIQDGYVLPAPIDAIFANGRQNDVPLLLGFAKDEALGGFGGIKDLADYQARAATRFGDRAPAFLKLYPASNDDEARTQARLADRDETMVSAMKAWAVAQSAHGRAPVYSYMFARAHSYAPGAVLTDLDPATAGSYHTSEVPFWLGSLESFNSFRKTRAWTAADRAFSAAMTDALVAFARSGNPATATRRWPIFAGQRPQLMELGATAAPAAWPSDERLGFFGQVPARPAPVGAMRD